MNLKIFLAAAATGAAIVGASAQINSPMPDGFLERAVLMYTDGNYFGCLDQLSELDDKDISSDQKILTLYYQALATVHTDKKEAEILLNKFLADYPQSTLKPSVKLHLADCYYGTDYRHALEIYETIDPYSLDPKEREDLYYRSAFCNLTIENYDGALPLFEKVAQSSTYGNASLLYRGYIAYIKQDYPKAEKLLTSVNADKEPGSMAEFYLSQIYYVKGDYRQALSAAKKLLKRSGIDMQFVAEANRIAGESAYCLGDAPLAVKYLREYVADTESPMPSSLYILGQSEYNTGEYAEAIKYLSPVTENEDAMGQCANLYLGQAYLHEGDYDAAAMAFNRALNMDYDQQARETAYYNYAVTLTKGGKAPFASTIDIFSNFLKLYPDSKYAPQVQKHIVNTYLTDNNYTAALASINSMAKPTAETLAAKQRVLYSLGVKSLASDNYPAALTYLQEARSLAKYDKKLDVETSLALGEALYRNGDYAKSAAEIESYLKKAPAKSENLQLAHYDLGYSLFAQKKYAAAATQFEKAVKGGTKIGQTALADAYNRLGDCLYYQKEFEKAENAYSTAYTTNPATGDYAMFQKALMAGFQRKHAKKIETLDQMREKFPSSALIPDALLETTESYIQTGDNKKAISTYQLLVEKYPNTPQGRQGYLQMALVLLNTGNKTQAIDTYKTIIKKYPSSDEAKQAVEQMKRIATDNNSLNDFMAFLKDVEGAPQIDESEAEQLLFEDAEKDYLTNSHTSKLKSFVTTYPNSTQCAQAYSYIIESCKAKGDDTETYKYAELLVNSYPASSYARNALEVKAEIEERQGKGNLALRTWKQLAESASSPAQLLKARLGVMRTALDAEQWEEAIKAADAVASSSGAGTDNLAQAAYSRGTALAATGKTTEARKAWGDAAEHTDNLYGIQSAYKLGESYLKSKDYDKAEKWAKKVANADSPHTYWIARGFILLSDTYTATGDKYKAKQYLQALRDNYNGTEEDIFEMIDQRLKK